MFDSDGIWQSFRYIFLVYRKCAEKENKKYMELFLLYIIFLVVHHLLLLIAYIFGRNIFLIYTSTGSSLPFAIHHLLVV